jgi:hypothetical protein
MLLSATEWILMLKKFPILAGFIFLCFSAQATDELSELLLIDPDGLSHMLQIELVNTQAGRARGLMFRESLAANSGMLFDFGQPQAVVMWMKNTLIPLDIVFIRGNGEIANIRENADPQSLQKIYSSGPVRATLEVNAGLIKQLGIVTGNRVIHPIFNFQ